MTGVQASLDEHGDLRLGGDYYTEVLRRLHAAFMPRSYFEIGSLAGETLRLSRCPTVAVDPVFQLKPDAVAENRRVQLVEKTSDDFFAAHDPKTMLGRPIDLAFLDGMHEFDFLLRDFINTEKSCHRGSMIVMHDCLPGHAWMTRSHRREPGYRPSNFPSYWTGDVWKIVPALKSMRPDLRITCLDALPTGLVAVTGLDPTSRVLEQNMDALTARWGAIDLEQYGLPRMLSDMDPVSADAWVTWVQPVSFAGLLRRKIRSAGIRARLAADALKRSVGGQPEPVS